jgi:hypothetical protein
MNSHFINPEFSNIKNIIFDFGAVLYNIDYMLTQKAFEQTKVNFMILSEQS